MYAILANLVQALTARKRFFSLLKCLDPQIYKFNLAMRIGLQEPAHSLRNKDNFLLQIGILPHIQQFPKLIPKSITALDVIKLFGIDVLE